MAIVRQQCKTAGRTIDLQTGAVAWQADGSVWLEMDDTVLLVTACAADPRPGLGFFPLTVEYRERRAAAGGFSGGFQKREGRPGRNEILGSRLVDRSIRPLFPAALTNEVQVIAQVLSAQPELDPSVLAITGASAALMLSSIPWDGPVAGVRIGRVDGRLVAFPTSDQREWSDLDIVVAVGPHGLLMVEGALREVPEAVVVEALMFAQRVAAPMIEAQQALRAQAGRTKRSVRPSVVPEDLRALVEAHAEQVRKALQVPAKQARREALQVVRDTALARFADAPDEVRVAAADAFAAMERDVARELIVSGQRFDGRGLRDVRPLHSQVGLLPRTHGSALFSRGETQALATVVIGAPEDRQIVETLFEEEVQRFYLHYNFPPLATGETRPLRGPGRREIGHGQLAQRAIEPIYPDEDAAPYTVRVISDILSSNGSSSMATVCAASLALMDAGVPIRCAVAGIAMGLVDHGGRLVVLTDILGDEDHLGDMDFKVCGTADGLTALQMDIKMDGLTAAVLTDALEQARQARLHVLAHMEQTLAAPRRHLHRSAPRIGVHHIDPDQIADLIGPGGRTIKGIQADTGARVDVDDSGRVLVLASSQAAVDAAMGRIRDLFREPRLGEVLTVRVKNVTDSFAFVELFPGTEAVLHVSEWAEGRIGSLRDVVRPDDTITVRVTGVDRRGRIAVSRRAAA